MSQDEAAEITVLHIDDDSAFTALARDSLLQHDARFDVIPTNSGRTGLSELSSDIDCIVCDYQMPGMDGLEVLKAVRAEYSDLPFILFTGEGSESVAAEAIQGGVTSYLQKESGTAQFSVLANRIRTHVEDYRARHRADRLEREYQLIAETATDIFFIGDLTTGELRVSDGVSQFGYNPEEIARSFDWWRENVHPDDREWMKTRHEAALEPNEKGFETFTGSKGWFESEYRWQRADGTYATIVGNGVTIFDDGTAVKQIGTMRDISERKTREEDLVLLESLLDYAHDAVYVVNAETGEIRRVNETACKHLGYDAETLVGMSVSDISKSHERPKTWADEKPSIEPGESFSHQDIHVRSDGKEFPVEMSVGYAEIDSEEYHIAVARDISARRERERELELVEALIERSNDEVYVMNAESGIFRRVNETACQNLQYEREDLIGSPVTSVSSRFDDLDEWRDHLQGLREINGVRDEARHLRADGSTYPVEVSVSFVEIDEQSYVITLARDITERKERERELERQKERLDDFATVLSHDLRNPLNVAQGRLELASEEYDCEHLEPVDQAHRRMKSMIGDLLTLAREGEAVKDPEPVDLSSISNGCWENVDTGDATIFVETDRTIRADESRLQQVFENLYRNAVEHGGEDLTVTVGAMDDGFFVEDDGPGIPEEDRVKIFEAGYSMSDEGTGFGLSIVKEIIEAHDWDIEATEGVQGGARFEITGVGFAAE